MPTFDKKQFSELLKLAKGKRSLNQFGLHSGVDPGYLSRFINLLRDNPPSPEVLQKIADAAHNGVTYIQLMEACGYIKEYSDITKETFGDSDFNKIYPLLVHVLNKHIQAKFGEKIDIGEAFDMLNDDEKAEIFNLVIEKIEYQLPDDDGKDGINIYPKIDIDSETIDKIMKAFKEHLDVSDVSLDYLIGASNVRNPYSNKNDLDEVDEFLLELKKKAKERGIEFDKNSVDDLLDLYEFIKNRDTKSN